MFGAIPTSCFSSLSSIIGDLSIFFFLSLSFLLLVEFMFNRGTIGRDERSWTRKYWANFYVTHYKILISGVLQSLSCFS